MPTAAITRFTGNRVVPFMNAEEAFSSQIVAVFPASTTLVAGTLVGEVTASPGTYAAYDSGNSDGTEVARGVLEYDVTTNSDGLITNLNEWGAAVLGAPLFTQGTFQVADLTGLDSGAVSDLNARYLEGGSGGGILYIP